MATVAEILSMASKLSGLRAETAELDVALMAANRAYLRSCLDAELTGTDVTYTVTAAAETLNASAVAGASVMRVQHLRVVSSNQTLQVQQASRQEVQDNRDSQNNTGSPIMYSVAYVAGQPALDFYPGVTVGDQLKMSYLANPLPLATATSTAAVITPTYMPELFHHDIITNAVVAALKERDGNIDEAASWNARSLEGMTRLEEYLGQMGGTANRAYLAPHTSTPRYPDIRR